MNQELVLLPPKCNIDAEAVREQERQRIARDLHDELGQQMLALRLEIEALCSRFNEVHPHLQGAASLVLAQLGTLTQSLRDVIRDLRPAALGNGLRFAVEWQCREFTRRFGIDCNLAWKAGDVVLMEHAAIALFRILQEALSNVHRHARATRVCVIVSLDHSHITMTVVDDGMGTEFGNHAKASSYGLTGMRERVIGLGGKLTICSTGDQGMSLAISLPI